MKDCTDRPVGVVDEQGTVVACNELSCIGEKWSVASLALATDQDSTVVSNGYTFKALPGWNGQFDYAAFAKGEDEQAALICSMAVIALNGAKVYYEEKHDKATFVKNIISDNILLGDIYVRAKELHFVSEVPRAVILIRQLGVPDVSAIDVISNLHPDRQTDFVLSMSETDVVLVKQVTESTDARELYRVAQNIQDALSRELAVKTVIGVGTITNHVRDLARAYKEAQVAIEVGKVFDTECSIINYENLGIGRLIYQLPTTLCEMFLREVFKKNPIDALDQETLFTINKFFENNLNVSETARKLFVHRNTLVYRLEKIKKITGLDLREFDDAITFKVALMVKKYLVSRGIET
jgi:carbohydrate diacid regulator